MLNVEALTVSHGKTILIGPVSFSVPAGSSLVIMGETGAGKSLIAQAIMGALSDALYSTGSIHVDGTRLDQLAQQEMEQLWGRKIAMLPQEPWRALDPLMRADQQVIESYRFVAATDTASAATNTHRDFETLGLSDAKHKRSGQLSGGMGQRVAFAAAMAGGAPVLLADEPTKGLDAQRTDTVIQALKQVPASNGVLVVITHDVSVATRVGGQILVMKEGEIVESGDTESVLSNPQHAYTKALIKADPQHWDDSHRSARDTGESSDAPMQLDQLVCGRNSTALTPAVDLLINKGRRIAITGPSGVGKSTLLDTVAGLIAPVSGSVSKATAFSPTDIQKVYQDPPAAFASTLSLRKHLADVAKLHHVPWYTVEETLGQLGVSLDLLDRKPDAVSGGELQRIAIARALMVKPKILLADEPTSRLDPLTQQQTMALLGSVTDQTDTAVILVTHDHALAEKWSDAVVSLG